ncbi:signal transduction histidine kinase [Saccharothrix tamanrassetensis]|uniref:histidine kinase n=1 Tax=Saccharothrix tamanrassetensis TaxID=1051531 RepID=A0A841CQT7_9PSEU|nr:HAMP domain-containing sensor histidine kinase [Saccharothrix tamanrassetensis]MBB5959659.1 signal transduction histidine kinase [Saccharothrix tamanrassetensis]
MLRLTLRWRVAMVLGLGSLLLTSTLAIAIWNLASGYMLRQREQSGVRQAEVNARLVAESLRTGSGGLNELLTGLATSQDSTVLLFRPGQVLTSGRQVDPTRLPPRLLELGRRGVPAAQRLIVDGVPVLAVTLPMSSAGGAYVELAPMVQLDRTFRFLSGLLVACAVVSGLLGVALGFWASRRALRPLTELTNAASRIAGGDLRARLPAQADPDLTPLATTFNVTADALEQRVIKDARFAGDVSHELRSPLTTMVNAAAVLHRRRAEVPGTAGKALELLTSEIDRFARMVVDLLEISRTDQRADDTTLEPIDLAVLVENVIAARPGRAVAVEADAPAPQVLGDRRRLDRVVANLLDNADRHAGGAVRVAVLSRRGMARLEVDDGGPGVPAALRDRIFDRFDRGARAGSRGGDTGSGLGLALVAQHVQRHGGTARVEQRPGGGARFIVEIPEADR